MAQSFNLIPAHKLCSNCRKKLTNIEEGNFDKEEQDTEMLNVRVFASPFVGSRDKIGYGKRKLAEICDELNVDNDKFF